MMRHPVEAELMMNMNLQQKCSNRLLLAISIGSIFEIFDFLSFIFLTPIISKVFFPSSLHNRALIFTYLTISASYLFRPIGGLILANLGDKYGRKSVFSISILLMSLPAIVIALLPGYIMIGYLATIILVFARILQGFSLGGEVPGAITYLAEQFQHKNYFFYCSLLTLGANLGVGLAAGLISILNHYTSPYFMDTIGWRLPFLLGGLLTIVGVYIRNKAHESTAFKTLQQTKQISNAPLISLFRNFPRQLLCGMILCLVVSVNTSVFHLFLPTLLTNYYHLPLTVSTTMSALGALILGVCSVVYAYLSPRIGIINLLYLGTIALIAILSFVLWWLMKINLANIHINYFYWLIISISLALAAINGVFLGILADLFPTYVRFSGISLCYNLAFILGAGLTPLWSNLLMQTTFAYQGIIAVCLSITIITLINCSWLKRI